MLHGVCIGSDWMHLYVSIAWIEYRQSFMASFDGNMKGEAKARGNDTHLLELYTFNFFFCFLALSEDY